MTEKIKAYWEEKWINRFTEDGQIPSKFVVKMQQLLQNKPIKSVLDLGAGKGRDSLWLSGRGYEVTALDISESALVYVQSLNPKIKTICCDIAAFDGSKDKYDWVIANLSLHYWNDATTRKIVSEIYKTLNPGGFFAIKCKSTSDFDYGEGVKIGEDIYEKDHIRHFFSIEYMRDILHDFEIEFLEETEVEEKHYGRYRAIETLASKKTNV